MADYRCARCQWAHKELDRRATALTCRKDTPTLLGSQRGLWPYVAPSDWCGQFSPKRQEPWTATVEEPRGAE